MKVKIITAEHTQKTCPKCKGIIFRHSTKSKYTNKEKTEGITYQLNICDGCGNREQFNEINWYIEKARA